MTATNEDPLIEARHVSKHFYFRNPGLFGTPIGTVRAVDDVSLKLARREILALVGESGCGKSTLARVLAFLYRPSAGEIWFRGTPTAGRQAARTRRDIQMIFQDPNGALNPRWTVSAIISEPLRIHQPRADHRNRVSDLMEAVGLSPTHGERYPHEFRGVNASGSASPEPWR